MNYIKSQDFIIELEENSPVLITKSISDVLEPEKRKRDSSKEIILPGTANNLKFFKGYFSFTSSSNDFNFDATKKVKADYYSGNNNIFPNCFIVLNDVTLKGGTYFFSINLFSEIKNVFLELRKHDVSDLDYSDMNHTLNKTTIKNSWAFTNDYVYSLVDAGNRELSDTWRTVDFYPYVRVSRIINQMLIHVGVDPSSFVFDNEIQNYLDEMVYGFGGGERSKLSPLEISERLVNAEGTFQFVPDNSTGVSSLTNLKSDYSAVTTDNIINNTLNQYAPYVIQVARSGRYAITFNADGESTFPPVPPTPPFQSRNKLFDAYNEIRVNGVVKSTVKDSNDLFVLNNSIDLNLTSGDVIEFHFFGGQYLDYVDSGDPIVPFTSIPVIPSDIDFDLEIKLESKDTTLVDGAIINVGDYIPKMNCATFLNGIIAMFNLYLSDTLSNGNTEISTLSKFYNPTNTAEDITEITDYSKEIKITPLANQFSKLIKFKYKENKDFDNQTYIERHGLSYGDFEITNQSDFAIGEKKFELPFSNVVPANDIIGVDAVIPRFVLDKGDGVFSENKGAPRIAFHNPITCNFKLADSSGGNIETISSASSLHHFLNYTDPTFDLNFTLVREVYYAVNKVTIKNLYNNFYSEFIEESTSPDARLIELSVNYTNFDIKQMTLKDLRFFKGAYYRLNKVIDFNGNTDSPTSTKIELVKVLAPIFKPKIVFGELPIQPELDSSKPILSNVDIGTISGTVSILPLASKNTNLFVKRSNAPVGVNIPAISIVNSVINIYNQNNDTLTLYYIGNLIVVIPAGVTTGYQYNGTTLIKLY